MNTTGLRIVPDTNVFINIFSRRGENRWIYNEMLSGNFLLCITNDILFEYWEVLEWKTRPQAALDVVNFLVVHPHVEQYAPYIKWNPMPHGPDDNEFPDCYLCCNARYLISNDRDFIPLKKVGFPKVNVLTTKEFKELYDKNRQPSI